MKKELHLPGSFAVLYRNIFYLIIFFLSFSKTFSQGAWIQKVNVGGNPRNSAVSFSIGGKGYIGTGWDGGTYYNDFWEYDPAGNSWTQKANLTGAGRFSAVGFSIGTKGYIGTGASGITTVNKDFWEWDQAGNTWTQKADFGGTARMCGVGFSIGTKGYIGTGRDFGIGNNNDLWEYDPAGNFWVQKADLPGSARERAAGFSIGSKGYVGTGSAGGWRMDDFYEWDQVTDTWTPKANYAGLPRDYATGFSIGSKGYLGLGTTSGTPLVSKDFYEYDPSADSWTQKANFEGSARYLAVGFSVGGKGYVGTGFSSPSYMNDLWKWDPNCSLSVTGTSTTVNCGASVTLNAAFVPSANASYAWSPTAGLNNTNISNPVATPNNNSTYQVIVLDAISQCMASGQFTIGWYPLGCVASGSAATVNCGTAVSLNVSVTPSSNNLVYSWSPAAGLSNATISNPVASPATSTTYSVTVNDLVTNCTGKSQITIGVVPQTCSVTGTHTICEGGSTTLTAAVSSASTNLSYTWSPASGLSNTSIANPVASPTAVVNYTVVAKDTVTQCISAAQFSVAISTPLISASAPFQICKGELANLCAYGGMNYSWSGGQTTSCTMVSPTTTTSYIVNGSNAFGCSGSDTATILVNNCSATLTCLNNEGFEDGDFTGWTGFSGTNSGTGAISWSGGLNSLGANLPPSTLAQHTIFTASSLDPYAIDSLTNHPDLFMTTVSPSGGYYSVRLGNTNVGAGAEGLKVSYTPSSAENIFYYQYACVFQNAGHTTTHEPGFMVRVYDASSVIIPALCDTIYGPDPVVPFLHVAASAPDPSVLYRRWSSVGINLNTYIGQTVTIEFVNFDCSETGHWGYTYLDVSCSGIVTVASHLKAETIAVYPNPTTGDLSIHLPGTLFYTGSYRSTVQIALYDMYGNEIFRTKINQENETLNIEEMKSGIYFLHINTGSGITIKKIIKE